jgi:hypothetical protein
VSRLFLISCVAGKTAHQASAAELYTSTWFVNARSLVQASGSPWFILSAEHGLLAPSAITAPYNKTLNTMAARQRWDWAKKSSGRWKWIFQRSRRLSCWLAPGTAKT